MRIKKIAALIEARMGSTRLPGKVMKQAINKPLIHHLINRLKFTRKLDKIIVATTNNKKDDELCRYLKINNIKFYRGSENDVLGRLYNAAKLFKIKNILQITGDCPLIDPSIVTQVINTYNNNDFDFVSNANIRTFPIGMDISVFNFKSLKKANFLSKRSYYREHSTLYFRKNKKMFKTCNIMAPDNLHYPNLGLTLDEKKDYYLIKKIFTKFRRNQNSFTCEQIINYLKKNKKIFNINKKVTRKKLPIKI